jgi:hypothetical protein
MAQTNELPATKRAYTYCTGTRELIGTVDALLSPLEGIYPLPFNATFADPGEDPGPQKTRRLLPDGSAWEVVDDFRFVCLWNTATLAVVPNFVALGDKLPDGVTNKAPTLYGQLDHTANEWDASANDWRAVPDYRGHSYWLADGSFHTIDDIGVSPPADALDSPPPPVEHDDAKQVVQPSETESTEVT